jgi:hypothetical protein
MFPALVVDMAGPHHRLHGAVRVTHFSVSPERIDNDALFLESAVVIHAHGD